MAKRPTSIKQVADAAGVSTATVSNVFSGKKPVKPELAAKVRETATKLGYHVNRVASNLRSGQSQVVPVMVPDLSDPFFTSLITEIEALGEADGYDIIVASSKDDPTIQDRRIDALLSWQPAGLIIVPCSDEVPGPLEALRGQIPVILADRGAAVSGFDRIRPDNTGAGALVGEHLAQLGHMRVLIVASDMKLEVIRQRCSGVVDAIEVVGGNAQIVEIGPNPAIGAQRLQAWFDDNPLPSAVFAATDMTTLAVLTCLADMKLDVGHDISVVGFDDYPWMNARRTPITAIMQPIDQMAAAIWATLKARLAGDEPPDLNDGLKCKLEVRASTRRADDTRLHFLNGKAGLGGQRKQADG